MSEGKPGRPDQASDQLLGAAGFSVERMPMLHVIFDQMTNLCAESLRSMSPSQSYFSLSSVGSSRLSDILDHYEGEFNRGRVLRAGLGRADPDRL